MHAALVRQEDAVTILDLGSANGTLVNGKRLPANQPRVLQDGDEIGFGELSARVYFKQRL
jgi:pSer/pThr/pTyr-binding forkhead associated (FHA) protein